jgi:hypothetical protein
LRARGRPQFAPTAELQSLIKKGGKDLMDLSKLYKRETALFNGYRIPASFELAGKCFDAVFDGGEKTRLDFAAAPGMEVALGSGKAYPYKCVKTGTNSYLVSYTDGSTCTSFAIDTESGLITRIDTDDSAKTSCSFGAISPASAGGQCIATGDFAGNAFEWSFGPEAQYIVKAQYEENSVSVSFPYAGAASLAASLAASSSAPLAASSSALPAASPAAPPAAAVSGFSAVRLAEGVYLQNAAVTINGQLFSVSLVTDLTNMLCRGLVFGVNNGNTTHEIIGGYGCAAKQDMTQNKFNKFGRHAIVQFIPPHCFELAGQRFIFNMDDGDDFILNFKSKEDAEWSCGTQPPKPEKYACLKADDYTYFISYEISGLHPRVNHTFVIDTENMLVTRIVSSIGKNKRWPYLMTTDIEFGAIWQENAEYKSYPRHGHTSDMIGNVVEWAYGSDMSTTHAYHDANFYRITFARSRHASLEEAREAYAFNNMAYNLPSSDEPTDYIKIKDGMYLVSLTEKNCEKLLGATNGFRSNTLCFLQNYKGGGYVAGRAFGTSTTGGGDTDTNIMIGAYGYFIGPADEELKGLLSNPIPYLV